MFSCEFCEISKNIFFTEHVWATASVLVLLHIVWVDYRSSHSEVLLGKGVLKKCSKFTGEHPSRREIALRLGCSPVNLLLLKNSSGRLLLRLITRNILTKTIYLTKFDKVATRNSVKIYHLKK